MEDKKWPGWLVLSCIVVVAAVALALTNILTKSSIADQNASKAQEQLQAMFPDADKGAAGFEPLVLKENSGLLYAYTVKQGGNPIGYAGAANVQGYGGLMEVAVGMDASGTLKGISVGGSEFKETEGLGSKAKEDAFRGQFAGKQPPLSLGTDIDAISGATITSRAVVDGVNHASEKLWFAVGIVPNEKQGAPAGKTANASVLGYGGPVLVRLMEDDAGTIVSLTVGAARFQETEGVGSKVKEETFTSQFIGKKPPLNLDTIDAVSGATVSSQAVVDAVNAAHAFMHK